MTQHPLTGDEIAAGIEYSGSRRDAAEVDDLCAAIQDDIEAWWAEHMDTVEDGVLVPVHEDDDTLVFADTAGHFWNEQLDAIDVDEPETHRALIKAQHEAARRLCDYSWSAATPVVVSKPADFNHGQDFDHRHLMWLMSECGLTGAVALDYLMVEWHGMSQRQWAIRAGKDQGGVSQNVRKANQHVIR